jgi:hypothetical protein
VTDLHVQIPDEVSARFVAAAAERGTSTEEVVAEVLTLHAPEPHSRSLLFTGMFEAPPGALSVAEAERRLEDGEDERFAR